MRLFPSHDNPGQVAGYAMRDLLPGGLGGSAPFLLGEGIMVYMNPKLWPIIAASSPRVASRFLRTYGDMMRSVSGSQTLFSQWSAFSSPRLTSLISNYTPICQSLCPLTALPTRVSVCGKTHHAHRLSPLVPPLPLTFSAPRLTALIVTGKQIGRAHV